MTQGHQDINIYAQRVIVFKNCLSKQKCIISKDARNQCNGHTYLLFKDLNTDTNAKFHFYEILTKTSACIFHSLEIKKCLVKTHNSTSELS